ncbi:MAG TPA: BamA/TamA family outer membrane protein [Puia sp.]|nr:BamA/TamA family outer membrane protein [Puia sp.]
MLPIVLSTLVFSCTIPKNYQANKPFVYSVTIKVEGNFKSGERQDLEARLANQLDDSLRTQIVSLAGIRKTLINPPVFDSMNLRRSLAFMVALLNASGYYSIAIKDSVHIDTVRGKNHFSVNFHHVYPRIPKRRLPEQYRAMIDFRVTPGKQLKFDSIGFALNTPELQALTLQSRPQSLLKKNKPFSKQVLSAELDRLVELFRNNGYYKFSKDDLYIEKDTVVAALIDPTLDPFQQAALLEQLKRKRENPTVNVVVLQHPVKDSSRITKYYIGRVTVYPDLPVLEDTVTVTTTDTSTTPKFTIISRYDKFKHSFLTSNIYLRPDRLYKQSDYNRTFNRFNQLGAWQTASIDLAPSVRSDSVLDVSLRLYPAKKQYLNTGMEISRNTYDIVTASNLFGVGMPLGLINRNTFRQSILSNTNLHGGVEFGGDFIQTTQVSLSHTISIPRLIAPFKVKKGYRLDSIHTVLILNGSYTDRYLDNRQPFFTLRSLNAAWGYEWSHNNRSYLYRPLNIEYTQLVQTDSFRRYINNTPSLKLAFKTGLVVSQQFVYSSIKKTENRTNFLRISGEESGALLGLIKSVDEGDLWRFIKGDIEYRHHIDYRRTQLAMRAYAGAGWAYGREGNTWEQTLPFYKAFFAGGPNSMRGWQVRQLGLGSSAFYDTLGGGNFNDRFGDIQLEGNIEYRFPLGLLFGIKLQSALYVDAGNIWNRHQTDAARRDIGSDFAFDRFYKEFAVDAGTGFRLDFDWFVIRFDWAYRLKDPGRLENPDKWFYNMRLSDGQFQLGIGYPF